MAASFDHIVIGGGHNGLVCAAYLAKARKKVLVLEAADRLGGASVTREFAPGFRVSACAHLLSQMQRRDSSPTSASPVTACASPPAPCRPWLCRRPPEFDPRQHRPFRGRRPGLSRLCRAQGAGFAESLLPILGMTPPRLGTDAWSDRRDLLKLAWAIRRLGQTEMRELLRIIGMNAYDLAKKHFESSLLERRARLSNT